MAGKEYLLNRNEVVYYSGCSKKFEPNYDGVVERNISESTFCINLALRNRGIKKPPINVIKAVPFVKAKEKFIEKNYNVLIPVGTKMTEIDSFLLRVGKFADAIDDNLNQSIKGIKRLHKGDTLKFRTKEGQIFMEYGDKIGPEEYYQDGENGPITDVEIPVSISIKENRFGSRKSNRKDREGNDFNFFESPTEDITEEIKETVRSQVNTVCSTPIFKIIIKDLRNIQCIDKASGSYKAIANGKMFTLNE